VGVLLLGTLQGQERSDARVSQEKQAALEWLSSPHVVERFGRVSDAIWSFAELGLQEFKSSGLLIKTLEAEGFSIAKGLAGMPTCFVASYGAGKPVVGILAEYDALPMLSQKGRTARHVPLVEGAPGHGCGHNLMGTAAAAAAIAVKEAMQKNEIVGTIKVFGSPAEEMLISRPYMVRAGLFEGVDVVINNHTTSDFKTGYGVRGSALYSVIYMFSGTTAHSAVSPWSGRSALDAVEIMNVATNYLREHLHYTHRMHHVILKGGEAPNVVPDQASVWYFLRNTDKRLEDMYQRVLQCAKGAALATGTELSDVRIIAAIHQAHHNKALAELVYENIKLVGMPEWTEQEHEFAMALQKAMGSEEKGMPTEVGDMGKPESVFTGGPSSDHGDVTLIAPTATVGFPGLVPGARVHHWSNVTCNQGSLAWKGLNAGAKAMAATAIDLLTQPERLTQIRREFEAYVKEHPYKSFLPADARVPLKINEALMNKYRPLMEKF